MEKYAVSLGQLQKTTALLLGLLFYGEWLYCTWVQRHKKNEEKKRGRGSTANTPKSSLSLGGGEGFVGAGHAQQATCFFLVVVVQWANRRVFPSHSVPSPAGPPVPDGSGTGTDTSSRASSRSSAHQPKLCITYRGTLRRRLLSHHNINHILPIIVPISHTICDSLCPVCHLRARLFL